MKSHRDNIPNWLSYLEKRINSAFSSITSLLNIVPTLPFVANINRKEFYDATTYTIILDGKGFGNDINNITIGIEDLNGNDFSSYVTINTKSIVYNNTQIGLTIAIGNLPPSSTSLAHFKLTIAGYSFYSPIITLYDKAVFTNTLQGSTNDASTNVVTFKDSDGNIVEKVNTDGFYQTRYRDVFPGGTWVVPNGVSAPDDVTVIIGGIPYRLKAFDGVNTVEVQANSFEIDHYFDLEALNAETINLEIHIHMLPSTNNAGTIKFFIDYCYIPADGAPIAQTSVSVKRTFLANSQYNQLLAGVEIPKPSSGYDIGDVILFNVRRNPLDSEDQYAFDALFLQCALHAPVDGNGSRQRYIK